MSRSLITPNDQFFEIQKGEIPDIDQDNWSLKITGKIEKNLLFNYDNFTDLDSEKITATLECVEGPYGTAVWEGVPLIEILDMAKLEDDAYDVIFYAADNYSDSLSITEASAENVLLAYKMNGEKLPEEHGFPLRLVCPDHYGYKWVKWITKIQVVDYDYIGFWEERGWSDSAMRTNFSGWITHAYLFSITFIFAGLSFISGSKFMSRESIFKDLPKFVNIRFHKISSLLFVALSFISFVYWGIATFLLRGAIFYSFHGIGALISMSLIGIGALYSWKRLNRTENGKNIHQKISTAAFYFYLFSILFGLLIATVGGFRLNQILFKF